MTAIPKQGSCPPLSHEEVWRISTAQIMEVKLPWHINTRLTQTNLGTNIQLCISLPVSISYGTHCNTSIYRWNNS